MTATEELANRALSTQGYLVCYTYSPRKIGARVATVRTGPNEVKHPFTVTATATREEWLTQYELIYGRKPEKPLPDNVLFYKFVTD